MGNRTLLERSIYGRGKPLDFTWQLLGHVSRQTGDRLKTPSLDALVLMPPGWRWPLTLTTRALGSPINTWGAVDAGRPPAERLRRLSMAAVSIELYLALADRCEPLTLEATLTFSQRRGWVSLGA